MREHAAHSSSDDERGTAGAAPIDDRGQQAAGREVGTQGVPMVEQQVRPTRIRGDERMRRARRLRSSRDFQSVRRRGRSQGGQLLSMGYARITVPQGVQTTPVPSRVGFSVSKRVGGAVVRNLVKRRVRESIRRDLSRLAPGWDIVITARPAAAHATYHALHDELTALLSRAKLLAREPTQA